MVKRGARPGSRRCRLGLSLVLAVLAGCTVTWVPIESGLLFLLGRNDHVWLNVDASNKDAADPPIDEFRVLGVVHQDGIPDADQMPFSLLPSDWGVPLSLSVEIDNLDRNRLAVCSAVVQSDCRSSDEGCVTHYMKQARSQSSRYSPCKLDDKGDKLFHNPTTSTEPKIGLDITINSGDIRPSTKNRLGLPNCLWVVWVENHNRFQSADIEFSLSTRVDVIRHLLRSLLEFFIPPELWEILWAMIPTQIWDSVWTLHERMQSSPMCQNQKSFWFRGKSRPRHEIVTAVQMLLIPFVYSPTAAEYIGLQIGKIPTLWVDGHTIIFTIAATNLVMFVIQVLHKDMGIEKFAISRDTYSLWRLFTSTFTHCGVIHLVYNLAALVEFGPSIHLLLDCNNYAFAFVYTVAAFSAGWSVYYLTGQGARTLGASGAIYGVMAAKFVLEGAEPKAGLTQFGAWILVDTIQTAFLQLGVSWQGHLGGAVGGAMAAYIWLST